MRNVRYTFKSLMSKLSLSLSDLLCLNLSLFIAIVFIRLSSGNILDEVFQKDLGPKFLIHLFLSVICVGWFWIRLHHFTYRKPFWFELKEVLRTIIIFSVIELAIAGLPQKDDSHSIWLLSWGLALILVPAARAVVKKLLDHYRLWKQKSVIIGCGKNAHDAWLALQSEEMMGFDVVAFYDVDGSSDKKMWQGIPVLQDEHSLWQQTGSDAQFIVAVEHEQCQSRDFWLKNLAKHQCCSVSVIPSLRGVPLYGTDIAYIFSHEVMILRVNNNLAKCTSRFMKRCFDIVGAMGIIILLSPALLVLSLMVAHDGGSPIYGHERIGFNGRKFKCLKFRSMVINSQEVLQEVLRTDPVARAEWNKDFKLKNDPRITRIGHFIRRTSLDELPQLWNVVRGDMSLVGPRPVIEDELIRYASDVDYYLMAKPGMTGLWQVSGRNDVDYDTRVYFDSWYVKNWSLWNDIAILFKTISVVLRRDGAY